MRTLSAFVAGVLLSGGMFGLVRAYQTPHCPQEDSCQVDYSHGKWTVTEVTP